MSIQFVVNRETLEAALKSLDEAEKKGYPASQAILHLATVGRRLDECLTAFDGWVMARKTPDDPKTNYGSVKLEHLDDRKGVR